MPARLPLAWFTFRRAGEPAHRLYVHSDPTNLLWHGPDLIDAIAFPDLIALAAAHDTLDEGTTLPGWFGPTGAPIPFLHTDQVRALAADDAELLECVDEIVAGIRNTRPGPVTRTREPAPVIDLGARRSLGFSVSSAARVLSRDPVITIGREALLQALRDLEWVERDEVYAFAPTAASTTAGWLVRNDVWLPGSRVSYNRIRITLAGLHELHRRLGGIAALAVDEAPLQPLVEVP